MRPARPALIILSAFALVAGLNLTAQNDAIPNSAPSPSPSSSSSATPSPTHPAPRLRGAQNARPATLDGKPSLGISGFEPKWANFGRYLQTFADTVQLRWEYLNDKSSVHPPSGTKISVRFRIDSEGKITEIIDTDVNGANGGAQATRICVSAIADGAPYVKWTDAMIAKLGYSQEMTLTFFYGGQQPKKSERGADKNPTPTKPLLSTDVYDLSALDEVPHGGLQTPPAYPAEMKRQGISGVVTLAFVLDTEGHARDITIVKSTNEAFNKPAIEALQKWKFRPGKKNGKSVNTRMQIPIAFDTSDDGP